MCMTLWTQASVQAHTIPGLLYHIYSNGCDFSLAAILQQVQPIKIKDLHGTKTYELLEHAFKAGEPIPDLITHLSKKDSDIPSKGEWKKDFEDTIVYVEHVVVYLSRVLHSSKWNYSPTERNALTLKEGLIKFQPCLEGEKIFTITNQVALRWSWTFQNVNQWLLMWGLFFSAFQNMRITHQAGRIHLNFNPVSHLWCHLPPQRSPLDNEFDPLKPAEDALCDMFNKLELKVKAKLLM